MTPMRQNISWIFAFIFLMPKMAIAQNEIDSRLLYMAEAISSYDQSVETYQKAPDLYSVLHSFANQNYPEAYEVIESSTQISIEQRSLLNKFVDLYSENSEEAQDALNTLETCANENSGEHILKFICADLLTTDGLYINQVERSKKYALIASDSLSNIPAGKSGPYIELHTLDALFTVFMVDENAAKATEVGEKIVNLVKSENLKINTTIFLASLLQISRLENNELEAVALSELLINASVNASIDDKAYALLTAARTHFDFNQHGKAIELFDQAAEILDDPYDIATSMFGKALSHAKLGEIEEAKQTLESIFSRTDLDENSVASFSIWEGETRQIIAESDADIHAAYENLKNWTNAQILELQEANALDQKRASEALILSEATLADRLKNAELEANLAQSKVRQQRTMLMGGAVLFILTTLFTIFLMDRSRKLARSNQRLEVKTKEAMAASDAKQRFIGMIGHELRTPLNPIIALSDQISARPDNKSNPSYAKIINASGNRLFHLVENMLYLTDGKAPEIAFMRENVDDIVGDVLQELLPELETKPINIDVRPSVDWLGYHQTSRPIVETILRNLIGNAIKFTNT